jgi:hypothetical protein
MGAGIWLLAAIFELLQDTGDFYLAMILCTLWIQIISNESRND